MGSGFLRSKADKREIEALIMFITELLPVSRRENVILIVVEEEETQFLQQKLNISFYN
jgi:hypothetical protein